MRLRGKLSLSNETQLSFNYKLNKVDKVYAIPYDQVADLEYGQKAGRRVGAAIATTILISPAGLMLLFSKSGSITSPSVIATLTEKNRLLSSN